MKINVLCLTSIIKGENVKVPRSLASFCSVSGGSGFGVFNV